MTNTTTNEPTRVMVDIETLGIAPGSAIISIGAVKFSIDGLGDEFYEEIDRTSCQEVGLEVDADTLEWWRNRDESVQGVLTGGDPLVDVLKSFHSWFPSHSAEVWANSPAFDCEHLEAAFSAVGMSEPWEYSEERDVRTLESLPCAAEVEMEGNKHNALDDAKHQARVVSETLHSLSSK